MGVYSAQNEAPVYMYHFCVRMWHNAYTYNTNHCLYANGTDGGPWGGASLQITPLHDIGAEK